LRLEGVEVRDAGIEGYGDPPPDAIVTRWGGVGVVGGFACAWVALSLAKVLGHSVVGVVGLGSGGSFVGGRSTVGGVVYDSLVPEPRGRSDGGELRVGGTDAMEESREAQDE
jgi:hypothetical protein